MIRSCRFLLKELRKLSNNTEDVLYIDAFADNPRIVNLENEERFCEFSNTKIAKEFNASINELSNLNFIKFEKEQMFTLTSKGLHPYETTWEAVKIFLLKSVLVPVVVSVAATLITLWLSA